MRMRSSVHHARLSSRRNVYPHVSDKKQTVRNEYKYAIFVGHVHDPTTHTYTEDRIRAVLQSCEKLRNKGRVASCSIGSQ